MKETLAGATLHVHEIYKPANKAPAAKATIPIAPWLFEAPASYDETPAGWVELPACSVELPAATDEDCSWAVLAGQSVTVDPQSVMVTKVAEDTVSVTISALANAAVAATKAIVENCILIICVVTVVVIG